MQKQNGERQRPGEASQNAGFMEGWEKLRKNPLPLHEGSAPISYAKSRLILLGFLLS